MTVELASAIQSSTLVDLSLTVREELPGTWPGHMYYQHKLWNWYTPLDLGSGITIKSQSPYHTRYVIMDEHVATHFDAPSHFIPPPGSGLPLAGDAGRETGEKVPLEDLNGSAAVIDVQHVESLENGVSPWVTEQHVQQWETANGPLVAGEIVLLRTGWDRYYVEGSEGEKYVLRPVQRKDFPGWPAPSVGLITYLLDKGIRCLGVDAPSIGAAHGGALQHQVGLARKIRFVEGLTALDKLPPRGAYFLFLPVKIGDSSGGPGRAIAFL